MLNFNDKAVRPRTVNKVLDWNTSSALSNTLSKGPADGLKTVYINNKINKIYFIVGFLLVSYTFNNLLPNISNTHALSTGIMKNNIADAGTQMASIIM